MSWILRLLALLAGMVLAFLQGSTAHAMIGEKIDSRFLSSSEQAKVKRLINTQIKSDLVMHFDERMNDLAARSAPQAAANHMSRATQAVLLKGAYDALMAQSPVAVSGATFNKNLGHVLDWLAAHSVFPQGVTVGVLARKSWGEGYTAGFNYGAEANFYLQNGKLMMTNYSLKGAQVGVGSATSDVEFYFAFCFGSCYGGDPNGWYMGMDGNIAGGLGVGMFAEVGVDVSSLYTALFSSSQAFSINDIYQASTVYVGFGFEEGIGGELALGLYRYNQIGLDTVLANPGAQLSSSLISSQASHLKP
jgi:hypothetical protein